MIGNISAVEISTLLGIPIWALIIVIVWSLIWKGLALWKAARKNSVIWFVILLVVNTMGILEILYIFLFSEMNFDDVDADIKKERKEKGLLDKKKKRKRKK